MAYYSGGGKLSAVDAILAEAADLVALEQIAKLNTAHLADDSALPSSLETRFRKLKSLPSPAAPPPVRTLTRSVTAPGPAAALRGPNPPAPAPAPPEHHRAPAVHEDPPPPLPGEAETNGGESSPRQARAPVPAPAVHDADAEDDAEDLERLFGSGPRGQPTLRERNRGRESSSASPSPPPPRQACCFGFSPKKPLQRTSAKAKKKVHHGSGDVLGVDAGDWGDENRRMATEFREQQRRLRKALEDQVQVSRETAKMARWVKQASARMTLVEAIDDLLSDCEDDEELK